MKPGSPLHQFLCALTAVILSLLPIVARAQSEATRPWPRIIVPPQAELKEPMQLKEMKVLAQIVGLHVEVTTTLTFLNPNQRALEGELSFPLPDGAIVTGYALDVNGQMVDGVVVKKEKARVAFETEVRKGVDPGIVEHLAGNVYRTRIYPLPSQGTRTVRVRYVAELPADQKGDAAWRLPLPLGETVGKLTIKVEVAQGTVTPQIGGFGDLHFQALENRWVAEKELRDVKPGEELWVAMPKLPAQVASVERVPEGDVFFSISDTLDAASANAEVKPPAKLGIAWDASGSRGGAHLQRELALLKELFSQRRIPQIVLVIFRDRPEDAVVFRGDYETLLKTLKEAPCDGGTDFEALGESMKALADVDQWLLFTDGLDTLTSKLPSFDKRRVTAVVSQNVANRELLRQVCADSGGQVIDLQKLQPTEGAAAIMNPAARLVGVRGSGIAEVQGIGSAARGRVSVHGKLVAEDAELSLEYSDGRISPLVKLSKKTARDGVILASAWAGERVNQLGVRAEANEEELLALGRRFGLVSPVTSLIVLENLDQYVRNDIEPPASLADMRRQWAERKALDGKMAQEKRASKFDRVLAMWKERVAWWETARKVAPDFKWKGVQSGNSPSEPSMQSEVLRAEPTPAGDVRNQVVPRSEPQSYAATDILSEPEIEVSKITVKPWDPATPYLALLKEASRDDCYKVYLEQRKIYATSPAFFLDCGDFFLREGDTANGIRVLTNLAELNLEDAGLLRVLAWRLQKAGEMDRSIVLLRKVAKLRPEEPQSLRDLSLALVERGKQSRSVADINEAMTLLEKMIFSEWDRFEEIELIGLEELNALIAWSKSQDWTRDAVRSSLDGRLVKNLDTDVRIVMSWDADNTDVDLHVLEPSGEEAAYNHNQTTIGGLVSRDFTQGYGPEEYLVRRAQPGTYKIYAHYYGSHQQTVTGAPTITATVFTDFGRSMEKKQVMTLRLDRPNDKADIGQIQIGSSNPSTSKEGATGGVTLPGRDIFLTLQVGQSPSDVRRFVGPPQQKRARLWIYRDGNREYRVRFAEENVVEAVIEVLPGGVEAILVQ